MQSNDFIMLYEAQFKRIYNYISYRIHNHTDTEDLVSQVFLRVIEKYETYNPNYGSLDVWTVSIAKNIVTDYFREQKRHPITNIDVIEPFLSDYTDAQDPLMTTVRQQELLQALDVLTERERHVIALKYAMDLKNKEISEVLSLSESNIGVILFRSLAKLRKKMVKEDELCNNMKMDHSSN